MRVFKVFVILSFTAALLTSEVLTRTASSQSGSEAPASFDNQTNGFTDQMTFDADRIIFEGREEIADGLGPVYNAQSCAECHQNPVTGGISQIFELRAGRNSTTFSGGGGGIVISPARIAMFGPVIPANSFVPAPGGSLIQARAIDASIQERVADGSRITFSGAQQLVSVMGFDGGQYGAVGNTPVDGFFPSFSPDGAQIVFQRTVGGSSNIFSMNVDGTELQQLTTSGQDASPAWAPNGTKIAFASRRTGRWQIFLMNIDGTSQTNISNSSANDTRPGWSPNGSSIAFTRAPLVPGVGKIWKMTATGGSQTQVTTGPGNDDRPTYAPDNTTLAFSTDRDGNWEIYTISSFGGTATRLTNNLAADINPAWAPDNSAIAFASNRGGVNRIWATSLDGSLQTQISASLGDQPAYSRDQGDIVRTFRSSLTILGDGFVEAIDDSTLLAIRDAQPSAMRGTAISVPLAEAPGETRLGRFGWKNSVASLLSFSAGAYLLEMGITSPLQPNESTSLGRNVMLFDTVPDPEDTGGPQGFGEDVEAFTRFMRSTKAPPRDLTLVPNDSTDPGSALFDQVSCSVCHVRSITTAPVGTVFNGGTFVVTTALGDKVIHPFSDFLLHDIGTGDGIVETNGEVTRNKVRTPPLWGLRTRDRLMHDGGSSSPPSNSGAQSFTLNEAIMRHAGQASTSRSAYQALTPLQKAQLFRFLKSL
ncbi:MAG: di-heme oxidoredictase family protein [Pyrinomonadaceae bacterium]